jgi:hypothetical protein
MDTSTDDPRLKKASQHVLERDMGIIPSIILQRKIDIKAANHLVEHGLLIYRDDLLVESDDWESDGYIKLLPEGDELSFVHHLLMFDILPSNWQCTFSIPDEWKERLSANSIDFLNTMPIYREQLNPLQPSQSASERPFDINREQEKDVDFDCENCSVNHGEKNGKNSILFFFCFS